MSPFAVESVLCHSTEKLRRGTLLCSTKVLVSKKIKDKRGEGGRRKGVSQFSAEIFCLTVPEVFVGEPFCPAFQKVSGSEEVYG